MSAGQDWYCWIIVLISFFTHAIADGVSFSFGILMPSLVEQFDEQVGRGHVAGLGALMIGVFWGAGPVASGLSSYYGYRAVAMGGAVMACLGYALTAFIPYYPVLYITFGLVAGLGLCMVYLPAVVMVSLYFDTRRSLATGLAVCGSGVGTFLFAPLTQALLNQYGWRGALLMHAALLLQCAALAAMYRDPPANKTSSSPPEKDVKSTSNHELQLSQNEFKKLNDNMKYFSQNNERNNQIDKIDDTVIICDKTPEYRTSVHYNNNDKISSEFVDATKYRYSRGSENGSIDGKLDFIATGPRYASGAINTAPDHGHMSLYNKHGHELVNRSDSVKLITTLNDENRQNNGNIIQNGFVSNGKIPEMPDTVRRKSDNCIKNEINNQINTTPNNYLNNNVSDKTSSTKMTSSGFSSHPFSSHGEIYKARGDQPILSENRTTKSLQHLWQHPKPNRSESINDSITKSCTGNRLPNSKKDLRQNFGSSRELLQLSTLMIHKPKSACASSSHNIASISKDGELTSIKLQNNESESVENPTKGYLCGVDWSMLSDSALLMFGASNFLSCVSASIPYILLPDLALLSGVEPGHAAFLVSVLGISNTLTRIVFGLLADYRCVKRLLLYSTALLLAGLASLPVVQLSAYPLLVLYAFVFGGCMGIYACLLPIVLIDLFSLEKLSQSFGLILLSHGLGAVIGPPIAGWLFDVTRSYDSSFYFTGAVMALSGLMLFPLPCVPRRDYPRAKY